MRATIVLIGLSLGLAGCIHVDREPAPTNTTVVVPPGSSTTTICSNGATSC